MLRLWILSFVLIATTAIMPAWAQDADALAKTMPPLSVEKMEAHVGPIRVSPDGPAIIRLDEDAGSVIVGNPTHASAVLESPRTVLLMPGAPGATKIIALNRQGKTILDRSVVVGGGSSEYMRVSRNCALAGDAACAPASVYYCPDRCYETSIGAENEQAGAGGSIGAPSSPQGGDTPPPPGYIEPQ